MVTIKTDSFNGTTNAPITGWDVLSGTWIYASGKANCTTIGQAWLLHAGMTGYPTQTVQVLSGGAGASARHHSVVARSDATAENCYLFDAYQANTVETSYYTLWKRVNGTKTSLATWQPGTIFSNTVTIRLECNGTSLSCYAGGSLLGVVEDSTFSGGEYAGLFSENNNTRFDDYLCEGTFAATFSVVPSTLLIGTLSNVCTATCNAGNYTPGTPGAPILTADAGLITGQTVTDANTITFYFNTPGAPTVVTITDPLNGLTDTINVGGIADTCCEEVLEAIGTPGVAETIFQQLHEIGDKLRPNEAPTFPTPFFEQFFEFDWSVPSITLAVQAGDALHNSLIGLDSVTSALAAILGICANHLNLGQDTNITVHNIETVAHYTLLDVMNTIRGTSSIDNTNLWDYLHDLRTPNGYTLGDILLAIDGVKGSPGKTVQQVYDLIDAGVPVDLTDVLTILNNLTATNTQTLQTVLDAIAGVRGLGNPDLATVVTAVAGVAAAILALDSSMDSWFDTIINTPAYGLHPIKDQLEQVHTEVTNGFSGVNTKLDNILTAIQNIAIPAAPIVPPIWPGLARVTVGTGVPIATGFNVPGPLDGVIVNITGVPPNTGQYSFNGSPSWTHIGALAFVTDNGQKEFAQSFGFESAIITPKTMVQAASAVGRAKQGLAGTVYPWTIHS